MHFLLLYACMPRVPQADDLYAWSQSHQTAAGTLEEIAADRAVFKSTCGECHLPPAARWFDAEKWPHIVEKMRTKEHAKFDDPTRDQVLRYLELATTWDESVRAEKHAPK